MTHFKNGDNVIHHKYGAGKVFVVFFSNKGKLRQINVAFKNGKSLAFLHRGNKREISQGLGLIPECNDMFCSKIDCLKPTKNIYNVLKELIDDMR